MSADQGVMSLEKLAPGAVAELGGPCGRADDVREQDGGKHSLWFGRLPAAALPDAGQKLLDLPNDRLAVSDPGEVVVARKLNVDGIGNVLCGVACVLEVAIAIAGAVQDH